MGLAVDTRVWRRGRCPKSLTDFRRIAARAAAGKDPLAEPADPMLGGLSVAAWFELFWNTHEPTGLGGVRRTEWPEPGGVGDQPHVAVVALTTVLSAVTKEAEDEARRNGNQ
jgi:hypothetical protein